MHANPLFRTGADKSIFEFCKTEEMRNDIYKSIELHSLLKFKKNNEKKKFWIRFGSNFFKFLVFIYYLKYFY